MDISCDAADRKPRCAIAIMAKAPRAGRIKTRLHPFLTPEEATELGCCFLTDMTSNLAAVTRELPLDGYIAFAPAGSEAVFAPPRCHRQGRSRYRRARSGQAQARSRA